MILDLAYTSKNLYKFNQVRFRSMYSLLGLSATGPHTKILCHLVNALTDKADICTKKKS